jgi:hypothetical protein
MLKITCLWCACCVTKNWMWNSHCDSWPRTWASIVLERLPPVGESKCALLYRCGSDDVSLASKSKMLSSISAMVNSRIVINRTRWATRDSGGVLVAVGTGEIAWEFVVLDINCRRLLFDVGFERGVGDFMVLVWRRFGSVRKKFLNLCWTIMFLYWNQ